MKIEYIHFSEPNKIKTYDTVKALRNNAFIKKSQEEFDKMEMANMERDKRNGYILSYKIKEE